MADHRFGPSRTLRNFLGSITSSLSSLPSNPFRWHLPSSLPLLPPLPSSSPPPPPPIPPASPPHHSPPPLATSSPLYPPLEMEESRKRMRFAAQDDVRVAAASASNKKHKHSPAAENLGETKAVDDVHMAPAESNCTTSATPNASSVILQIPGKTPPPTEPLITPKAENFDETLVGYVERISAAKKRTGKRGQDKGVRDVVRNKRIKASKSDAGTNAVSGLKRKEPDDFFSGFKYEKRLRKLTISEGRAQKNDHDMDAKQDLEQSVAAATIHADDKLRRSICVHNLPQNAKRSDISKLFSRYGAIESISMEAATASYKPLIRRRNPSRDEMDKTKISQTASVVFKDEQSAIAALTLNVKGFNGSYIFVTAACSSTRVSEDFSGLPYDLAHAAIISNLPSDIKDEDLLKILHGYSSNIRIEAMRVLRNARSEHGASAYVIFRSLSNVYTVQLKSKDATIQVSQVSTSTKRTRKEPVAHTMKRRRDPKADDGNIQKKGTTNKDIRTEQYQLPTSKNDNESESTKNTSADSLSGRKQKREEKHQRGISRSKKIRRT